MAGLVPASGVATYPLAYFMNAELIGSLLLGFVLATPVYHYVQAAWRRLLTRVSAGFVQLTMETAYMLCLIGLFVLAVAYLAADTYNPFIYFRF